MPKYPHIFVSVADGAPRSVIIDRVSAAFKRAEVAAASRASFMECVPSQYAMTIDYVRQWVETD